MTKTIVVVSSLVDSTIREYQTDVNFVLFQTLEDLDTYIRTTPLRAESLFFTRDTIPYENTSLNYFANMLQNPFLAIDKVVYITERNSKELVSVKYIISVKDFTNWEIIEGYLTREYVNGIINGTLRTDTISARRKAVYRVPRSEYINSRLKSTDSLESSYIDDEKYFQNIPDEVPPVDIPPERESYCQIIHVVGDDCDERTLFAYLIAQYMSFTGKTLIVERDIEYHLLSEYITKSHIDAYLLDIEDVLHNPLKAIENIKRSPNQLICIISKSRIRYSYAFIINILYNNLVNHISYLIREDTFEEVPNTSPYVVAIPTTLPGILQACERIDPVFAHYAHFVGVNLKSLPEIRINSSKAMETIISDILGVANVNAIILNASTLKIGGEGGYDLGSILGKEKV